ncbi:MAG: methylmalonyl Co-A mutase-associated GTPase MeaB [Gammaproteobacteria bacterium]|nr:methylmalonyl Co-A mutase-associated GTPase MeaB [Gammaproteobacteria bacterium]
MNTAASSLRDASAAVLAGRLLGGDRGALAHAITRAEHGGECAIALLERLHAHTGRAWRIGVTGPPGAGKSTLTGALVRELRAASATVGVIAVDPTSPFTHGAILGDRVRMSGVSNDSGVYIRSMATRGAVGGLSRAAGDAADLVDAAGFDYVVVETAGVGQTELDIADAADTTLLVLVPEGGDFVQALKAGIMEIADLYVLNKSDRPGAHEALLAVRSMLIAGHPAGGGWRREIHPAVATESRGVAEVAAAIASHRRFLTESGELARRRGAHLARRVRRLVEGMLEPQLWDEVRTRELNSGVDDLLHGRLSPHRLAERIVASFRAGVAAPATRR